MVTVSLRFDDEMKKELDEMCEEMGMNLTTFFMIYAKKALRDRRIPFDIVAPVNDSSQKRIFETQSHNGHSYDEYFERFVMPTDRGVKTDEYIKGIRADDRV